MKPFVMETRASEFVGSKPTKGDGGVGCRGDDKIVFFTPSNFSMYNLWYDALLIMILVILGTKAACNPPIQVKDMIAWVKRPIICLIIYYFGTNMCFFYLKKKITRQRRQTNVIEILTAL